MSEASYEKIEEGFKYCIHICERKECDGDKEIDRKKNMRRQIISVLISQM